MITRNLKLAAAIVCLVYILVQSFQWWVFARVPDGADPVVNFLNGHHTLNIIRSWSMLLSMFGLFFISFVVSVMAYQYNRPWALLALVNLFIFSLLEIVLRSIELFYVQVQLPEAYLANTDPVHRQHIMDTVSTFLGVQGAVYFPLGLGWMLGSLILALIFPNNRAHFIVKFVFFLNAARLLARMLTNYLGMGLLGNEVYDVIYLPLVCLTFGPLAYWLYRNKN